MDGALGKSCMERCAMQETKVTKRKVIDEAYVRLLMERGRERKHVKGFEIFQFAYLVRP